MEISNGLRIKPFWTPQCTMAVEYGMFNLFQNMNIFVSTCAAFQFGWNGQWYCKQLLSQAVSVWNIHHCLSYKSKLTEKAHSNKQIKHLHTGNVDPMNLIALKLFSGTIFWSLMFVWLFNAVGTENLKAFFPIQFGQHISIHQENKDLGFHISNLKQRVIK